jgi:hypothetical protein
LLALSRRPGDSAGNASKISRKFDLAIEVKNSRVTASTVLNALELEGPKDAIDKAVRWLKCREIRIDAGE